MAITGTAVSCGTISPQSDMTRDQSVTVVVTYFMARIEIRSSRSKSVKAGLSQENLRMKRNCQEAGTEE